MGTRVVMFIANKGGAAKTTCAILEADSLGRQHGSTLFVDCDPQATGWKWGQAVGEELPFRLIDPATVAAAVKRRGDSALVELIEEAGVDYVVIDTPPGFEHADVLRAAVMAATDVIIPMAPSGVELAQAEPTVQFLGETRPDVPVRVLLNRVKAGTQIAREIRVLLDEMGLPVMTASVPDRVLIEGAYGTLPGDWPNTLEVRILRAQLDDVAEELVNG